MTPDPTPTRPIARGPRDAVPAPRRAGARTRTGALVLGAVLSAVAAAAPYELDEETKTLLVEAVEAAAALDFYNARCRSDISGRHTDRLNRELAGALRTTVVAVQDDFFPERSYRAAQARLQEQFQKMLKEADGCKGAKESGLAERLKETYRERFEAVEALP